MSSSAGATLPPREDSQEFVNFFAYHKLEPTWQALRADQVTREEYEITRAPLKRLEDITSNEQEGPLTLKGFTIPAAEGGRRFYEVRPEGIFTAHDILTGLHPEEVFLHVQDPEKNQDTGDER